MKNNTTTEQPEKNKAAKALGITAGITGLTLLGTAIGMGLTNKASKNLADIKKFIPDNTPSIKTISKKEKNKIKVKQRLADIEAVSSLPGKTAAEKYKYAKMQSKKSPNKTTGQAAYNFYKSLTKKDALNNATKRRGEYMNYCFISDFGFGNLFGAAPVKAATNVSKSQKAKEIAELVANKYKKKPDRGVQSLPTRLPGERAKSRLGYQTTSPALGRSYSLSSSAGGFPENAR